MGPIYATVRKEMKRPGIIRRHLEKRRSELKKNENELFEKFENRWLALQLDYEEHSEPPNPRQRRDKLEAVFNLAGERGVRCVQEGSGPWPLHRPCVAHLREFVNYRHPQLRRVCSTQLDAFPVESSRSGGK